MILDCVAHWFPAHDVQAFSLQRLVDAFRRIPKIERIKTGEDPNDHRAFVEERVGSLRRANGN